MNKKLQQHLREIQKRGALYREATVGAIDVDARTVELSFSSETEKVERWFGIEILGHDANEVDLSRMNNKAPVLWMHDMRDQRGVVVDGSARVDADRIGRCTARYSKSAEGEKLFQDIVDGITTKVSVGYNVTGMRLVEERDGIEVYRITAWQPYEVSNVSVAADDDVGVGRSLENPPEEPPHEQAEDSNINTSFTNPSKDNRTMNIKNVRNAKGQLVRAKVDDNNNIVEELEVLEEAGAGERAAGQRGTEAERARSAAILAMGEQYSATVPNARELASQMVREGKSEKDMQEALLRAFNERAAQPLSDQNQHAEVGMSDADVRRYSFMNVFRALANPNDAKAQQAAAFEIECGIAAQRTLGRTAQGILVPPDVLSRAMNAGGVAGNQVGAQMIDNDVMRGSFIDLLRNRCIGMQLATVIAGLVGNADIPKKTAEGQGYWLGEDQDTTETGFSLGQISISPKTVGAFTEITRKLLQQSSMGVEAMVRSDLISALGMTIDKAYWYGPGTEHQPRGLKNQSGINAVDFATSGQPTFAELVKMETEIAADNADIGSMAYVGNSRFRGHCKTTPKFGTGTEATIWEAGGTVNGYRTEITNQLLADDLFFGNFADSFIALWGGLDLTLDPFSLSKKGGVRIVAFQDVDMGLRRQESICWGSAAAL